MAATYALPKPNEEEIVVLASQGGHLVNVDARSEAARHAARIDYCYVALTVRFQQTLVLEYGHVRP